MAPVDIQVVAVDPITGKPSREQAAVAMVGQAMARLELDEHAEERVRRVLTAWAMELLRFQDEAAIALDAHERMSRELRDWQTKHARTCRTMPRG